MAETWNPREMRLEIAAVADALRRLADETTPTR